MAHESTSDRRLPYLVARVQAWILAFSFALLFGFGLFIITAWLVVKGGPHVGRHLQLLGQYFIGYSVSWTGAFIGLFYGLITGGAVGWLIGMIYNLIAGLRFR